MGRRMWCKCLPYNQSVFYYYVTNLQGDVVGIVDKNGNQIVSYTYDAWGNLLSISGSKASTVGLYNPLRYRGYVYDTETELYYLQSRYYDPSLGRFLNADTFTSTGQGLLGNNMFAYCRNNPISRRDVAGTSDEKADDLDGDPTGNDDELKGSASTGSQYTPTTSMKAYYPPNNGFKGQTTETVLEKGSLIQRTGPTNGRFVAPAGTPTYTLSLPYNQAGQPTTVYVVNQPVTVIAGVAAPWFNSLGGGTQYLLLCGNVQFLLDNNMISLYGG